MKSQHYQANIWKLNIIRLLFWMHFFAAVLVPFYMTWGGLSLSQMFTLNAWFMLCNAIFEAPTGTVADYLGRKASLILGSLVGAVAALIYVSTPNFYVFLLAEAVFAIAYTLHSGADEALACDSLLQGGTPESTKKVLTRMESFKLIGILIGTVTGGFLAASFGLKASMTAYVAPALLACGVALTLKEPAQGRTKVEKPSYKTLFMEGARFFLNNKALLLLTLELAVSNALVWGIIWLFQPALERGGLPIAYFGLVHAACCIGQIIFLSSVERIEGAIGSKRRLLVLSTILAGAAYIVLGASLWLPLVILAVVACCTFGLARVPVFSAYMNAFIPSDKRATVLSMSSTCRTLAIVLINPVIGFLADWSLSATMLILGAGLILLAVFSRIEESHLANA